MTTLVAEPPPISSEYAHAADATSLAASAATMVWLLALASLSGLCVASCFLVLFTEAHPLVVAGHATIYALTLATAVKAGFGLTSVCGPGRARLRLDVLAGVGLVLIGFGPILAIGARDWPPYASLPAGVAYALLSATTFRHLLLYRGLARLFREAGRRRKAGLLITLGWIKMIYEGLWLACCAGGLLMAAIPTSMNFGDAVILFAIGAGYGTLGFGGVWLLMLVAHVQAAVVARRAAGRPA